MREFDIEMSALHVDVARFRKAKSPHRIVCPNVYVTPHRERVASAFSKCVCNVKK